MAYRPAGKYNPGYEAVYNRMMSTPVAPNIGGEILKNLLGAYVGGNLGEAKQNYLESQQEQERQRRLTDERSMLDYRANIENQARQQAAELDVKNRMGLLGYETALGRTDPAKYTMPPEVQSNVDAFLGALPGIESRTPEFAAEGIRNIMTGATYGDNAETGAKRELLSTGGLNVKPYEKPQYSYQTIKEKGVPMLYEVEAGSGKKRLIGEAQPSATSLLPFKTDQSNRALYMRQRDSLTKARAEMATFGATEEELSDLDDQINKYNNLLGDTRDGIAGKYKPTKGITKGDLWREVSSSGNAIAGKELLMKTYGYSSDTADNIIDEGIVKGYIK